MFGTDYDIVTNKCDDRCGDNITVKGKCDDGNQVNGDGCSSNCNI
jgi:cysteine-rich repeat protein